MAIVGKVPGLEVSVVLDDDERLIEYTNVEEDVITVEHGKKTVYIESQAGRSFYIFYSFDETFPYPKGKVTSAKSRKESPDQYIDTTEVCVEGVWQEQTFSFAEIPTSEDLEDDDQALDSAQLPVGVVSLTWFRCAPKGETRKAYMGEPAYGTLPERHIKGLSTSHQVHLETSKIIEPPDLTELKYPYGHEPFATFEFRYRPRSVLRSLGILLLSPSLSAIPSSADASQPELDSLDHALQSSRAHSESHTTVKSEYALERGSPELGEQPRKDGQPIDEPHIISTTPGTVKEEPPSGSNVSITETEAEPKIEQMSREELAKARRKTRDQLNAAGVGIKREPPDAGLVRASSEERHVKRFRTKYKILVKGVDVIELDSDDD